MAWEYLQDLPSRGYFMSCVPEIVFKSDHDHDGAAQFLQDLPSRGYFSSSYIPMSSSKESGPKSMQEYLCDHETAAPKEQHVGTDPENVLTRYWKTGKTVEMEKIQLEMLIKLKKTAEQKGISAEQKGITNQKTKQKGNPRGKIEKKKIYKGTNKCFAEHTSKVRMIARALRKANEGTNKYLAEETSVKESLIKTPNFDHGDGHDSSSCRNEAEMLRARFLADKGLQKWAIQHVKALLQAWGGGPGTRGELFARAKKLTKAAVIARLKKSI